MLLFGQKIVNYSFKPNIWLDSGIPNSNQIPPFTTLYIIVFIPLEFEIEKCCSIDVLELIFYTQNVYKIVLFLRTGSGVNHTITRDVGFSLCEAIVAYDEGRVEDCCDILYPLRYNIVQIGGSNAQVINKTSSFLIFACFNALRLGVNLY